MSIISRIFGRVGRFYTRPIADTGGQAKRSAKNLREAWDAAFAEARPALRVREYGEKDRREALKTFRIMAWVYLALTLGIVGFGAWTLASAENGFDAFMALPIMLFAVLPGALTMRAAFSHWLVRKRSGRFKDWIARPGEWIPKAIVVALLLASAVAVQPGPAMAQDLDLPGVESGQAQGGLSSLDVDEFLASDFGPELRSYLAMVGGKLFSDGASDTLFTRAVRILNIAMITLGMLFLTYNIVVGIMQTAHEGEVLGKRWNSMWAPIRVIAATALMVPLGHGFNGAQHAIVWVAGVGVNTANIVWTEMVDAMIDEGLVIARPIPPNLVPTVQSAFDSLVCMHVLNINHQAAAAARTQTDAGIELPAVANWDEPPTTLRIGGLNGYQYWASGCGKFTISSFKVDEANASGADLFRKQFFDIQHEEFNRLLFGNKTGVLSDSNVGINAIAKQVARHYHPWTAAQGAQLPDPSIIPSYIETYNQSVTTRMIDAIGQQRGTDQLLAEWAERERERGGWYGAGAWFWSVARLTEDTLDAVFAFPNYTPRPDDPFRQTIAKQIFGTTTNTSTDVVREQFHEVMMKANRWFHDAVMSAEVPTTANAAVVDRMTRGPETQDQIAQILQAIDPMEYVSAFNVLDPNTVEGITNPHQKLIAFGHTIVNGTYIAIGVGAAAAGAAHFGGGIPLLAMVGDAFDFLSPLVIILLLALLVAGLSLAYILPLTVFFHWTLGVIGFVMVLFEAILAAPLWMFAHLRMDGEGLAGQAGARGYLIVLSIAMRPILMLGGLVLALGLFTIAVILVSTTWEVAIKGARGDHFGGLTGFVVTICAFAGILLMLAERCYRLVYEVPDRALRWIDGSGENLGENQDSERARNYVAGAITHTREGTSAASQVGQGATGARKELAHQNTVQKLRQRRGQGGGEASGGGGGGPSNDRANDQHIAQDGGVRPQKSDKA